MEYTAPQTRVLHVDPPSGHPLHAHTFPIFQTSTYLIDNPQHGADLFGGKVEGHMYSRMGNPTVEHFEDLVAALEGGVGAVSFGAGMGAIHAATLGLLKSGDHMISGDTLYGCTIELFNTRVPEMGISVSLVDTSDVKNVEAAWTPKTKLVYLESPANPTGKISDIEAIAKLCHEKGALLVVDATFSTPVFLRPLELGADISLHSITKYINGHGDVVGGVLSVKCKDLLAKIKSFRKDTGSLMAPMDAFLAIRGIKTLPLRMKTHCENGLKVAHFLETHPKVTKVLHPGLDSFPNHQITTKQMSGYGSTFSFLMKDFDAAKKLMENVKLCSLAVSLGCLDTLIEHPASMTHAAVPKEIMLKQGLSPELVRISVGLEDADDVIADLKQALDKC